MRKWDDALADARKATELKPNWGKGWSRLGAAQYGLGDLVAAKDAYEDGLKVDPDNAQLKSGLKAVDDAVAREMAEDGVGPDLGMDKLFSDPNMMSKLAANPKTASFLADPSFMQKLDSIRKNPKDLSLFIQDPRIMTAMGVMLGIDIHAGGPGSADMAADNFKREHEDAEEEMPHTAPPPKKEEAEPMEEVQENNEDKANKAAADNEKRLGNEFYKKREFDGAIEHYTKAWDLHHDIAYLTNLSAAYFEKGDYDAAIRESMRAVEAGREIYADFKIIAKAFGRIGSAYQRKGDLANAITYYQKSLTEHRTADTLTKLKEAERIKAEADRQAYIDPAKADEAREQANALFKAGDFAGSVKGYTEMIKRAPTDPRGYGNRAAAYIKLMSFPEAIKDCDTALGLDANFVKAYIRKAACYFAMRDYTKSMEMCQKATEVDAHPGNDHKNKREIEQQMQRTMTAMYSQQGDETEEQVLERASRDPEVVGILQDPVMQNILASAKENPSSLADHMRNPIVAQKVNNSIKFLLLHCG